MYCVYSQAVRTSSGSAPATAPPTPPFLAEVETPATPFGEIPAQRLYTTLGPREEPVTYWFTIGDTAVQSKLQKRLVDLRYGLTGQIPDGMLFRVSSIDGNQSRANQLQDDFVNQLLQAVSPEDRKRLSGLGKQ